MATKEI
jgi:iron-sulfur cluster assembly protein